MKKHISFSHVQKANFINLMEDHGYHLPIKNDERDDKMFSDLLFFMARSLDGDQADKFNSEL
jgi:hypothetical protein